MAINSSEEIGKEGEVSECFDCLELDASDKKVVCLWLKIRGRPTRQIFWWESVIDLPPG